jgi:septation ring formation regulator EzrA
MADNQENLTPDEKYYVDRYHFIYNEINRLQDNMQHLEAATSKLLKELEELRAQENKQKEKDGEI